MIQTGKTNATKKSKKTTVPTVKRVNKRKSGEGSIYQRKDGRWVGKIGFGFDENGKRKYKVIYGWNQADVTKQLSEISGRLISSNYSQIENKTFGELMFDWLMVFKKSAITARTFESDIRNFKIHIAPKIGNMKIYEVDTFVIQQLINDLVDKEYSVGTIKRHKHLISQFFEYAIDNKWVSINPVTKVRLRSKDKVMSKRGSYKALSPEIRYEFISKLKNGSNEFLKALCTLLMYSGLRIAEALALQWKDIDFNTNTIKIEQAITQIPKFDSEGNILSRQTVIGRTKTACSIREIPIIDVVIATLKNWKEYQTNRQITDDLVTGDIISPEAYVFANDDGTVRSYSGTRCIFNRFLKRNNLQKYDIHFHGLRHTFSNMMFEMNENPKVIQQLLGHRDVKTTITVYNSVNTTYVKESTEKLNDKVKNDFTFLEKEERKACIKKEQEDLTSKLNNKEFDDMLLALLEERKKRNND